MISIEKQNAHNGIKAAVYDLMWAIVALAEAESNESSETESDRAASLRSAILAVDIDGGLPEFQPADLMWLAHSILGGAEFAWLDDGLRQAILTDLDGARSALEAGAPLPPPVGALGYLAAMRPKRRPAGVPRPRPCCLQCGGPVRRPPGSCGSCCHRHHCNPHICH